MEVLWYTEPIFNCIYIWLQLSRAINPFRSDAFVCIIQEILDILSPRLSYTEHIFTIEYIKNNLQLNCDFLMYNRLKIRIQLILGNNQISQNDNIRPRLPFILYIIEAGGKGNKNTYFNSQNTGLNILTELQDKWSEKLNDEIRLDTLSNSF